MSYSCVLLRKSPTRALHAQCVYIKKVSVEGLHSFLRAVVSSPKQVATTAVARCGGQVVYEEQYHDNTR